MYIHRAIKPCVLVYGETVKLGVDAVTRMPISSHLSNAVLCSSSRSRPGNLLYMVNHCDALVSVFRFVFNVLFLHVGKNVRSK